MKNDVGGKLISLEDRGEKVWTVIVFNHFSKELMGFLSNAATVENLQFTQRKEELEIFNEKEAKLLIQSMSHQKHFQKLLVSI